MLTIEKRDELADMFRLLGDPNRLDIVLSCLDEPISVGTLVERLGLTQSLVSHHLRLLRASRLLKAVRKGKQVFYSLPDCHVRDMLANLIAHVDEPHEMPPEDPTEDNSDGRSGHDGEVRLP